MPKLKFLFLLTSCLALSVVITSCSRNNANDNYKDEFIKYDAVKLTAEEKQTVNELLKGLHLKYDPEMKMIARPISGFSLATDAKSGVFHDIRFSFSYAVYLLDLGDEQYTQLAFDVIEKTITTQDQDTTSKTCGIWPYFMEEPLATKKSGIDYNWADFCGVSLLDVWMGHQARIPEALKVKIKHALILAAKSIQKRNVTPSYTNIAIMGTYVTYMVSHLFDLPLMKDYAQNRLKNFYNYTLDKGGFSEYNSPTYSLCAINDLERMKRHIVYPEAKKMVDSLYNLEWNMIARHYHKPSGQWTGPHSRSYSSLISPLFYRLLKHASDGKIDEGLDLSIKPGLYYSGDVDVKNMHQIPGYLMPYFLSPEYPRTETDIFEKVKPQTIGTCYLTDKYALSTANRSSLWNQRRPFLVYWGDVKEPKYLQVRFLHDDYDFSSAYFFSCQKENKVLAAINFVSNGGDKHISGDRLKEGKFVAKDLRLRFEFGNVKSPDELSFQASANEPFSLMLDQLKFDIQLYCSEFTGLKGHWEKGGDGKKSWIDFVFYSGIETQFDLTKVSRAITGFSFILETSNFNQSFEKVKFTEKEGLMNIKWKEFVLEIPVKPQAPQNTFF